MTSPIQRLGVRSSTGNYKYWVASPGQIQWLEGFNWEVGVGGISWSDTEVSEEFNWGILGVGVFRYRGTINTGGVGGISWSDTVVMSEGSTGGSL